MKNERKSSTKNLCNKNKHRMIFRIEKGMTIDQIKLKSLLTLGNNLIFTFI
jgi:hypothetical protein